jgi:hypothetical protein
LVADALDRFVIEAPKSQISHLLTDVMFTLSTT